MIFQFHFSELYSNNKNTHRKKSVSRVELADTITRLYKQAGLAREEIATKMFISDGSNFRKVTRNIKEISFLLRFMVAVELSAKESANLMLMAANAVDGDRESAIFSTLDSFSAFLELIGAGDVSIADKNKILQKYGIDAVEA